MKKLFLLIVLSTFVVVQSWAYDVCVDGIYYNLIKKAKIASVTSGDMVYGLDITIPEQITVEGATYTVTNIEKEAFKDCPYLYSISSGDSVKSIGENAFENCLRLTTVTLPNTLTDIENCTFYNCNGLTSIKIPNSVISIGNQAFYKCTSLTSITIPDSVTSIGDESFENCTSLTSITIPDSVTSIGNKAFYGCSDLTNLIYNAKQLTSPWSMYSPFPETLTNVTIGDGVEVIPRRFLKDNSKITSITIPNSVRSIEGWAFQNCSGLTSITLSDSLKSIGQGAFLDCIGLTSITIPNSVTDVGHYAFMGCTGLTSITIPNSVISIGDRAFNGCTKLSSLTIGASVENISSNAFANCENLEKVICLANEVPSTDDTVFEGSYVEYASLFVPEASLEKYKASSPWNTFGSTNPIIDVTGISISESSVTLSIGDNKVLTANLMPDNATYTDVEWSSSDSNIATVDSNGKVQAINEGEATITVKSCINPSIFASCLVTVKKVTVDSISLNKDSITLELGGTYELNAMVSPDDATYKGVTWTSDNEKVATVTSEGVVTAVGVGNAKVKVSATDGSGVYAECAVTVTPVYVNDIALNHTEYTMQLGENVTLVATVSPDDAANKDVTWTSDNENVATVTSEGVVTAVGIGSAKIKATATDGSGVYAECVITVTPVYVNDIELNYTEYTMKVGEDVALEATVSPDNVTYKDITWTSDNEDVVTATSEGVVTAVGVGDAKIKAAATDGSGVYAVCKFTVLDAESGIKEISSEEDQTIFSIEGVRLSHSRKGVNIINGKKVLVK